MVQKPRAGEARIHSRMYNRAAAFYVQCVNATTNIRRLSYIYMVPTLSSRMGTSEVLEYANVVVLKRHHEDAITLLSMCRSRKNRNQWLNMA